MKIKQQLISRQMTPAIKDSNKLDKKQSQIKQHSFITTKTQNLSIFLNKNVKIKIT